MEYDFRHIEQKWQARWKENKTYKVVEDITKQKFYALDMFPYPSGAGLHVGHPLGYIASDIIARYKRHQGYNVLHPMGYDSFGLPAEQYAIQTGQHPEITTKTNIARYREQLDKIGFAYDWDREVRTSDPSYYKWTQWIFALIYNSWFNRDTNKAENISTLIKKFEENGNQNVNAVVEDGWWERLTPTLSGGEGDGLTPGHSPVERGAKNPDEFFFGKDWQGDFTATDWTSMNEEQQQLLLMNYRMTYLADSWVNWCPALGTVLANDEVKDGKSERGGHPVEQKLMRQWSMRISAYSERLIKGLDTIDWPENIKEVQRNWIGRSEGASIKFLVWSEGATPLSLRRGVGGEVIEVFTTRPDTIFGVSFMTLAPEHELVLQITTDEYRDAVDQYIANAKLKTERDRQADVKNVGGQFTGAYCIHPFTDEKIPVWIGEYVLIGYGTGAVMAVPAGDQRDWDFATKFDLPIPNIFEGVDISEKAEASKEAVLTNSDFLNGLAYKAATKKIITAIEEKGIGQGKVNYRMRDAVFSRQRYWGEPFPVYYKNEIPYLIDEKDGTVTLPEVDKYLPTEDGEPPLARAKREAWNVWKGDRMEYNTMPGWAGSSWYFLRYMDAHNNSAFASREKIDYWNQVDLYMGGAEHATGHLLYSRFWTKILFDHGYIGFDEPFKKMINQGMILGRSSFVYKLRIASGIDGVDDGRSFISMDEVPPLFVSKEYYELEQNSRGEFDHNLKINEYLNEWTNRIKEKYPENVGHLDSAGLQRLPVDIGMVDNDVLDLNEFRNWREELSNAEFILNDEGKYICGWEIEKMSKSKYNVQTPDELVEKFGADTLRMYEMFLGPVEQSKPWDTKGINGVHNFLRRFWRLSHSRNEAGAKGDSLSSGEGRGEASPLSLGRGAGGEAFFVSDDEPTKAELKTLHTAIKKVTEDLNRYSWNTVVSTLMICVNELTEQKCSKRQIIEPLCILLSPYAPHIAEELWEKLGEAKTPLSTGEGQGVRPVSITDAKWPAFNEAFLEVSSFDYPVSFNGKTRFFLPLAVELSQEEVTKAVMADKQTEKFLDGKEPKKIIVVVKRIVNVVV